MSCRQSLSLLAVALGCGVGWFAPAWGQSTPIAASGWNRDIVVENTATNPYSGFAQSFDTFNNWSWYERGTGTSTKGLPIGGTFTSVSDATIQGQFQPYNGNNALFLDVNAPTGTLTVDVAGRRPYEVLVIFASSSNQGGTGTMVVQFTDGTSSSSISFNAQDWFNVTTNNALNNLGRSNLTSDNFDEASSGNPRIYQTVVDMVALGLNTRAVESITFTKPNVGGASQNTVIMGISGRPVPGVVGACRYADGTCALLPQANCTGTYDGDNTTCPPPGACIAANGDCSVRTQANCAFVNGTYQGDNSSCPAPGACIAANGDCTQLNSFQCAFQNGNFLGAGMACPGNGGCCMSSGCVVVNPFQCAFQGGVFQGAATTCEYSYPAGIVVGGGSFEDISGTGVEATWAANNSDDGSSFVTIGFNFPFYGNVYGDVYIVTNGFLVFGASNTAYMNACPIPTTAAPNNAIYPYWDDLHIGSDTLAHPGRVYFEQRFSPNRFIVQWNRVGQYNVGQVPLDENTFQAVLFENGNIELRYDTLNPQTACDPTIGIENAGGTMGLNYDNTLLGSGGVSLSIAAQAPCSVGGNTGACCAGTTCSVTTSAMCSGANTRYVGDGSACNASGNNTTPCCLADYNQSGSVTVQDIFDFLSAYFTGCN